LDRKRSARRLSPDPVPELHATDDVGNTVENRVMLAAVRLQMDHLSETDRRALLSGLQDHETLTRRESVRQSVARHRARNRLRAMLDGTAGLAGFVWLRRRSASVSRWQVALSLAPVLSVALLTPLLHTPAPPATTTISAGSTTASAFTAGSAVEPPGAVGPAPVPASPRSHVPPPPATRNLPAAPPVAVPTIEAGVPTPRGDAIVGMRPKTEADALLCVSVRKETTCVESPITAPIGLP
jgi:hypothetical protein